MENIRKYLLGLALLLSTVCYSQNNKKHYKESIPPNIRAKILSLYPKATLGRIVRCNEHVSDTTQVVSVDCHCAETDGIIILTLDTNGNILIKEIDYNSLQRLPDTISHYIQKNKGPDVQFFNEMRKIVNNKGETYYEILMDERLNTRTQSYILRFKSTGELISKKTCW